MKRTTSKLFKNSKFFNNSQLAEHISLPKNDIHSQHIMEMINKLSPKKKELHIKRMENDLLEEVQVAINKGRKYKSIEYMDRDEALRNLKEATSIANTMLKIENFLEPTQKNILSQAYSEYAQALYKFTPEKVKVRNKSINKALELNPNNELAQSLNVTSSFYVPIVNQK